MKIKKKTKTKYTCARTIDKTFIQRILSITKLNSRVDRYMPFIYLMTKGLVICNDKESKLISKAVKFGQLHFYCRRRLLTNSTNIYIIHKPKNYFSPCFD